LSDIEGISFPSGTFEPSNMVGYWAGRIETVTTAVEDRSFRPSVTSRVINKTEFTAVSAAWSSTKGDRWSREKTAISIREEQFSLITGES
jgi:hypothetical protein